MAMKTGAQIPGLDSVAGLAGGGVPGLPDEANDLLAMQKSLAMEKIPETR